MKRSNLINTIIIIILIAGLGIGIYLVRQQQIFKGRAGGGGVEFFKCTSCGQFIALTGAITQGFTLNAAGDALVGLKFTAPTSYGGVAQFDAVSTQVPTKVSKPATSADTTANTPTPTQAQQAATDADGDGYPDSSDCGKNESKAHPGQILYFSTPYINNSGQSSFDYDCSGSETSPDSQDSVTDLPSPGCYTPDSSGNPPAGGQGWVSSLPACGQPMNHRRCNANDGLSCSGSQASYSLIGCPAASSTVKSWVIRDDDYGPRSCR